MAGSPKLADREQALAAARRRLRRLEIETHRIKAELARLEADYEDDIADQLARTFRRRGAAGDDRRSDLPHDVPPPSLPSGNFDSSRLPAVAVAPSALVRSRRPLVRTPFDPAKPDGESATGPPPPTVVAAPVVADAKSPVDRTGRAASYRRTAPPLMVSLGIHAAALLLCVTFTFATVGPQAFQLFASPTLLDEMPEAIGEIEITAHKFEDDELQNVVESDSEFNVSDNLLREFDPAKIGAGSQALGDIGQIDSLPSDLGTLMAGAGEPGSGKSGGPLGEAVFFGAQSKGDRFVYVVDNSSSMKGGRLQTATTELVKSVASLSPRQSFYVIFVSDQPYPMFYPTPERTLLPATNANKERLAQWLPKAILASGKNRELIKAMDLAASLQPHAVFLLWDGDMKYSDQVRMDVMTHLTRPDQWNFTIHTLGMGVNSLDAEHNLRAIAGAHGGLYWPINVPAAPRR